MIGEGVKVKVIKLGLTVVLNHSNKIFIKVSSREIWVSADGIRTVVLYSNFYINLYFYITISSSTRRVIMRSSDDKELAVTSSKSGDMANIRRNFDESFIIDSL